MNCKDCGRPCGTNTRCGPCSARALRAIVPIKETFDEFTETLTCYDGDGKLVPNPKDERVFVNSIYQVNMRSLGGDPVCMHLSIKRIDKSACKDWRHFQWIKNAVLGPEWCGMEMYPPESHLVDTSNQYHLWCFESDEHFGFMWKERLVSELSTRGAVQRPWPDDRRPKDLKSEEDLHTMLDKYQEEQS